MLGGDPMIMATMGQDAAPYIERLGKLGIECKHVKEVPETFTAQCFLTTDLDANQINAFHPGAMNHAHMNHVSRAKDEIAIGIVSPDGKDGMIQHAKEFAASDIPFIMDPGQQLPLFSKEELLTFLNQATWCTVNDYEACVISEKTGLSEAQIAEQLEAYIVTLGAKGSRIYCKGEVIEIPSIEVDDVVDPTGCGDAYRAGLLYGLERGWDIVKAAKLASLMGAIKIRHRGGQNHMLALDDIQQQFSETFGETF